VVAPEEELRNARRNGVLAVIFNGYCKVNSVISWGMIDICRLFERLQKLGQEKGLELKS
jgi:hypothetical protein